MNLYYFYADCGKMGFLDGLFLATEEQIKNLIGKKVYFDEVLGKYSEIAVTFGLEHIQMLSDDKELNQKILDKIKQTTLSGYNPLQYLEE